MLSQLKCAICFNEASGFNYKVDSCTGCRLFFRRSVVYNRRYDCAYKDNACIGDDGKVVNEHEKWNQPSTSQTTPHILPSPTLIEETMQLIIQQLLVQNGAHEKLRRSTHLLTPMDQPRMIDFIEGPSKMGMNLVDQDWSLEMPYANVWKTQKKFWELCDIVYSFEYIKSFKFVVEMSRADRTIFLKNSSMLCTVLTRAWYSYQQRSEVTINPDGIRAYAKWKSVDDLNFDTYVLSQFYSMTIDQEEYAILKAVIILNPDIPGLSEDARLLIGPIRQAYQSTLMSKCLARRGAVEGPKVYATMILLSPVITRQRLMRHADLRRLLISIRGTIFSCPLCEEMLTLKQSSYVACLEPQSHDILSVKSPSPHNLP